MKKTLKWSGIVILLLVVILLTVWIGWNAFDDKLDPRAAAYGAPRAVSVPDAENGYYAAIALNASDNADGVEYAKAWVAELRAAAKENRPEKLPIAKRAKRPLMCDIMQVSCVAVARDKSDEVTAQLSAYREDLERYEKLLGYKRYEEVMDYVVLVDAQLPNYSSMLNTQRAYLQQIALAVKAGNIEEGLAMLEREFSFRRVMLGGSHTMIGKMVANALSMRSLAFTGDLLQHHADELKPHAARLAAMTLPLDRTAMGMERFFENDYAWITLAIQNPTNADKIFGGPSPGFVKMPGAELLYKRNATRNKLFEFFSAMDAASLKPAINFTDEWRRIPPPPQIREFWDLFDNPVGKMMMAIAMPSYDSYVLRMHDLDAYHRLVGLRIAMLAADVDASGTPAFVEKSDARFHDPYTGRPMVWDAGSKRLSTQVSEHTLKRKYIFIDKGRAFVQM